MDLDEKRGFGFCTYCGNKLMLEEAIAKKIQIDSTHLIDNWIALGMNGLDRDTDDAEIYANKLLEQDLDNGMGWFIKGCAAIRTPSRSDEAIEYWSKASKLLSCREKEENLERFLMEVNKLYLPVLHKTRGPSSKKISHTVKGIVSDYFNGFDDDTACRLYYEGALAIVDATAHIQDCEPHYCLYWTAEDMLEVIILLDSDCRRIYKSYALLERTYKRERGVTLFDNPKAMIQPHDMAIEYYGAVADILKDVSSSLTDDDITSAWKYWSDEKIHRSKLNDIIQTNESKYISIGQGNFGKSKSKNRLLETIKSAYTELSHPPR
ncbi:MAG: hypothetical protein LBV63_02835 [Candidatus Methanoplasma sp.]|nr:hypothetical protein [Candidatus Methanoplasma sp.]